jgi:CheY-like chemotaxis protein
VTRVLVVDDDDIARRGMGAILEERPEIEVVGLLTHDQALAWEGDWAALDVVVVDAADPRRPDDHFPGVAVVERAQEAGGSRPPVVVVITGHFFDDAVRRRMREARADFFYHRSQVQEAEALCRAVLHPEAARAGVPEVTDPEVLFQLGIVGSSRVNEGVRAARDLGLAGPGTGGRSRARTRLRSTFNRAARLNPVNRDGSQPDRTQPDPSFPQIERVLRWATRTKDRDPG